MTKTGKDCYILLENAEFLPEVINYANKGYQVTIPLRGNSMRPYLEDGRDKAVLVTPDKELRVGDAVLALLPTKRYVLHRIVDISGEKITLLGDGNLVCDPMIRKEDVKLIVLAFKRKGRDKWEYTDTWNYKLYVRIWMALRPIRRYLLAIWRRLPGIIRNNTI